MVSVVIPTYNAASYMPKLLMALGEQSIPYELVIIDSESTDNTRQILQEAEIPYVSISKKDFNHGETRNVGLNLSSNEIVIFMTQDALPSAKDTLEKLVSSLEIRSNIAMAYGRQLPYPDADIFGRFARFNNYPSASLLKDYSMAKTLGIKTCSCSNSFAVYRKSLLQKIGGFPKDTILGEDVTVAASFILQGYAVYYCADSEVIHSHNYSVVEEFKRYFDIGVFHRQQRFIIDRFAKAESEGIRYVMQESKFLLKNGFGWLLPAQYLRTIAKYTGYKVGRNYEWLPAKISKLLSMHRNFW